MTPEEQDLLQKFLENLKSLPPTTLDKGADQLIKQAVAARADATYLLVQQALVLQLSLQQAEVQIAKLQHALSEAHAAPRTSSFLTGNVHSGGGYGGAVASRNGVSGLLQSAAAIAAGVAGGTFLLQGMETLFGNTAARSGGGRDPAAGPVEKNAAGTNYAHNTAPPGHWLLNGPDEDLTEDDKWV